MLLSLKIVKYANYFRRNMEKVSTKMPNLLKNNKLGTL